MPSRSLWQSPKLTNLRLLNAAIVIGLAGCLFAGSAQIASADSATTVPDKLAPKADAHSTSAAMPIFKLVEGAKGSPDPYTPKVLDIPAGKKVALDITDHIGGCALVTVFPGLGPDGGTVRARVPVGQTRRVLVIAAKPGRYRYHCSENMYFGEIVAH